MKIAQKLSQLTILIKRKTPTKNKKKKTLASQSDCIRFKRSHSPGSLWFFYAIRVRVSCLPEHTNEKFERCSVILFSYSFSLDLRRFSCENDVIRPFYMAKAVMYTSMYAIEMRKGKHAPMWIRFTQLLWALSNLWVCNEHAKSYIFPHQVLFWSAFLQTIVYLLLFKMNPLRYPQAKMNSGWGQASHKHVNQIGTKMNIWLSWLSAEINIRRSCVVCTLSIIHENKPDMMISLIWKKKFVGLCRPQTFLEGKNRR